MNWGELKAAIAAYTHRTDLDSLFPVFLKLAEQRIYNGEANTPKVRVSAMRQFAVLADGTRPVGFLEAVKVAEHDKPEHWLEYRPLERMPVEWKSYSWDGLVLTLSRDQSFPVDMTYHARFDTPVSDSDENWIMANAPAIYLASMLVEAYRWGEFGEKAATEAANYSSAVQALIAQDQDASRSGSVLRMKTRGP